jgi:hypothetical protein
MTWPAGLSFPFAVAACQKTSRSAMDLIKDISNMKQSLLIYLLKKKLKDMQQAIPALRKLNSLFKYPATHLSHIIFTAEICSVSNLTSGQTTKSFLR